MVSRAFSMGGAIGVVLTEVSRRRHDAGPDLPFDHMLEGRFSFIRNTQTEWKTDPPCMVLVLFSAVKRYAALRISF